MLGRNLFSLFSGKTVLVVDDSDMSNSVTKAILERYGMNVLVAQNGNEALTQFSESTIIAVTATVEPSDKKRTFECGMTDFLTKPIVPETLCQTIGRYLE